jgi:polyphosphate glucokinase
MTKGRPSRKPERGAQDRRGPSSGPGPHTLAIDIGGTALKASVLDRDGRMTVERVRLPTPYPCSPKILVSALVEFTAPLPSFDRISIGFPGVVRGGHVVTAPHFGTKAWRGYPLEAALAQRLGRPARLLNDAEVQGLGIVAGRGLEVVLTLGTGIGSAVFADGRLAPHLELAQHPLHNGETYNDYAGNEALRRYGKKKWTRRVIKTIGVVDLLLHYDVLYLGGGNARHLAVDLPQNVRTVSNDNGITGGIHLWDEAVWRHVRSGQPGKSRPENRRREDGRSPSAGTGRPDRPTAKRPRDHKHAITRAG